MPKIDAPTVAEHRARVLARLVDAAEAILRSGRAGHLTASAVATGAGIARNSIYRYVDSVDDLRALVVARHLPAWAAAVAAAMDCRDPEDRVVAWVGANLEQAALAGHGWLMDTVRAVPSPAGAEEVVDRAHGTMRESLLDAWGLLLDGDTERVDLAAALTLGLLEAGFRRLDAGAPLELVREMGTRAARGIVEALTAAREVGTAARETDTRAVVREADTRTVAPDVDAGAVAPERP